MTEILDKLRHAKYLSKLDMKQAYLQIPLEESSKEITAFVVPGGRRFFQFKRMPFGLTGAPATFQRYLDRLIGPEFEPYCYVYLDDIVIATDTFEDHLTNLQLIMARLREGGLKLIREKCEFCCKEIRYLGYLVNSHGLQPDPEKIKLILDYPQPKNLKQLRRLLGMASWYRRFIPNHATVIEPLNRLLKKTQKFVWKDEQEQAFNKIKILLTTAPILARPYFSQSFRIQTDASITGLEAVLYQTVSGHEGIITYASRSLSETEKKIIRHGEEMSSGSLGNSTFP